MNEAPQEPFKNDDYINMSFRYKVVCSLFGINYLSLKSTYRIWNTESQGGISQIFWS